MLKCIMCLHPSPRPSIFFQDILLNSSQNSEAKQLVEDCIIGRLCFPDSASLSITKMCSISPQHRRSHGYQNQETIPCCDLGAGCQGLRGRCCMQLMTQFEWTITGLQASDFKEAVCWYNYSLSIFPLQEGGSGVAKLQVGSSVTFGSVCI